MNGTQGVIENMRMTVKGSTVLAILSEGSGRLVKLDAATYGELDYAYARTVDRAQGVASVTEAYYLASAQRLDVHLGLVAASRHREQLYIHVTSEDQATAHAILGQHRLPSNAIELSRSFLDLRSF